MVYVRNRILEEIFFLLTQDCKLVGVSNQMNQVIKTDGQNF